MEESSTSVQNLAELTQGATLHPFLFSFFLFFRLVYSLVPLKSVILFVKPCLIVLSCLQVKVEEAACAYEVVESAGNEQGRTGTAASP